jgi:pimeloyl-ACP methyl ester carboxylesterase
MTGGTATWSPETFADAGSGIELCYQTMGDESARPLLLVMGIGAQMLNWPDGLCAELAERDFHVIRFDNRDCGRSTWLPELGAPSVTKAFARELDDPPYLLADMAADCVGLLNALEIEGAHVAGASLGGFIAQTFAFEYPDRLLSLASIMSSTGSGKVGQASPEALEALMTRPATEVEPYVEGVLAARRVIGSPGFPMDEAAVRETASRVFQRGLNPEGTQRQLVASVCSGNRTERLGEIMAPTVVLHGAADQLIDVSGGRATADAISGAKLVVIDGWGHDFPRALWAEIADAIATNADRVAA